METTFFNSQEPHAHICRCGHLSWMHGYTGRAGCSECGCMRYHRDLERSKAHYEREERERDRRRCDHESHGFYSHGYYMTCSRCGQVLTMDGKVAPAPRAPPPIHYPACPLSGSIGDPALALAAGCVCIP